MGTQVFLFETQTDPEDLLLGGTLYRVLPRKGGGGVRNIVEHQGSTTGPGVGHGCFTKQMQGHHLFTKVTLQPRGYYEAGCHTDIALRYAGQHTEEAVEG